MRVFFDFEFIEGGSAFVMEPISIGMVDEDGNEYYAEFADVDWSKASDWVLENVKPFLQGGEWVKTKAQVTEEIKNFVGEKPEFWAYFADYDWVILRQLFGRMVEDLPEGWPFYCLDIKQYMWHFGIGEEQIDVQNHQEHHALADAHWNRGAFLWMLNYQEMIQA